MQGASVMENVRMTLVLLAIIAVVRRMQDLTVSIMQGN